MNINYKQPQFELFPANSATLEDINKPKFMLANLTFSLESLVILSILGIMVALFSFSLGVERGKRIAAQTLDERVSAVWNVPQRSMVAPAVVASVMPEQQAVMARPLQEQRDGLFHGFAIGNGTRFTLQVATYGNEEYARHDALALKARSFPCFLIKSGKYWLLCIGNFTNKEAAIALSRKLPDQYRSSQVRRF